LIKLKYRRINIIMSTPNIPLKIPPGTSVLVIGPPRSEKELFAEQFIAEGVEKGSEELVIISSNFPDVFLRHLQHLSKNIDVKNIFFVDCYSNHVGLVRHDTDEVVHVSGPEALNEISMSSNKILEKIRNREIGIVFYSASPILIQNDFRDVYKFFHFTLGKLRKYRSRVVILVEENMHDRNTISMLESLTTKTIYFKRNKDQKFIEVIEKTGQKRIPYDVKDGKIIFRRG